MDIIICAAFGLDTEKTQLVKEIQELKPHSDPATIKNDDEFQFKPVSLNEELNALAIVGESVAKVIKTPAPLVFHFLYRNLSSKWRKAFALASQLQEREIANGIKRRRNGEAMKCALDEISVREEALAKKEGRKPDYYSQVITSEVSDTTKFINSMLMHPSQVDDVPDRRTRNYLFGNAMGPELHQR